MCTGCTGSIWLHLRGRRCGVTQTSRFQHHRAEAGLVCLDRRQGVAHQLRMGCLEVSHGAGVSGVRNFTNPGKFDTPGVPGLVDTCARVVGNCALLRVGHASE